MIDTTKRILFQKQQEDCSLQQNLFCYGYFIIRFIVNRLAH